MLTTTSMRRLLGVREAQRGVQLLPNQRWARLLPYSASSATHVMEAVELSRGGVVGEEGDVDPGDLVLAEIHLTDAVSVVQLEPAAVRPGDDRVRDHGGLSFGEDTGLRRTDAGDVTDG